MRRISVIVMVVSAILLVITGIIEALPHEGLAWHHIIVSILFVVAACVHAWYSRKPGLNYFRKLGWRWLVIVGVFVAVFALGRLIELSQ